ncbi:hypothetical protein MKW98_003816 [Papaver atlanticum]|uniref:Uncharacterized protein n=1 Tax=Papaver atlanticum TaxID=357466 RepID=A0AAD4T9I1_9MAGN|nr:hypothetical protein MKW98_003816 [Papaver atlanticum]
MHVNDHIRFFFFWFNELNSSYVICASTYVLSNAIISLYRNSSGFVVVQFTWFNCRCLLAKKKKPFARDPSEMQSVICSQGPICHISVARFPVGAKRMSCYPACEARNEDISLLVKLIKQLPAHKVNRLTSFCRWKVVALGIMEEHKDPEILSNLATS